MQVTSARRHLLLQGGLVLLIGLVAGLPMAEAIEADSPDAIRAWRAAHVGGVTGALLLMVSGLAIQDLRLGRWLPVFVISSAASIYILLFGFLLAALSGQRGIGPSEATVAGAIVEVFYEVGALGILFAVGQYLVGITLGIRESVRAPDEASGSQE